MNKEQVHTQEAILGVIILTGGKEFKLRLDR